LPCQADVLAELTQVPQRTREWFSGPPGHSEPIVSIILVNGNNIFTLLRQPDLSEMAAESCQAGA
jgi:hypothetical protein